MMDTKRHNVGQVNFIGSGFQPEILWAIVLDYNTISLDPKTNKSTEQQNGFALCIDNGSNTITAEADAIAGDKAPKPAKVEG